MASFFFLTHFRSLGQKSKNNFVQFLVQMRTRNFAFEINQPFERAKLFVLLMWYFFYHSQQDRSYFETCIVFFWFSFVDFRLNLFRLQYIVRRSILTLFSFNVFFCNSVTRKSFPFRPIFLDSSLEITYRI